MLTLPRLCFFIFVATGISLCWVHQQVELVTTSYQIAQKGRELTILESTRSHLRYRVMEMESPAQLDQKLDRSDTQLAFRDPARVVHLKRPRKQYVRSARTSPLRNVWEFFARSAEAKTRINTDKNNTD